MKTAMRKSECFFVVTGSYNKTTELSENDFRFFDLKDVRGVFTSRRDAEISLTQLDAEAKKIGDYLLIVRVPDILISEI